MKLVIVIIVLVASMLTSYQLLHLDAQGVKATKIGSADALARQKAYEESLRNKSAAPAKTTITAQPGKKSISVAEATVYLLDEVKALKAEVAELRREITVLKAKAR